MKCEIINGYIVCTAPFQGVCRVKYIRGGRYKINIDESTSVWPAEYIPSERGFFIYDGNISRVDFGGFHSVDILESEDKEI